MSTDLLSSDLMTGRCPALMPAGLQNLDYYSAGPLPRPPASVAVPKVADWMMLDNGPDPTCSHAPVGDCGVAGLEHGMMAGAEVAGETETFPDANAAVAYYLAYTPGHQDTGVVLSQYLQRVRQDGYYGHKVPAYAPVAVHDLPLLHTAIWMYDFAYCGIVVTQQMQADFAAGNPWTLESLVSEVEGKHCVPLVAYDDQYLYAVTWGAVQRISYPAWHFMSEEAWAVLTGELDKGDGRGVNYAALTADLDRLADD